LNQGLAKLSPHVEVCLSWMKYTFNNMGDKLPNSTQIHLPSFFSWKLLHNDVNAFLTLHGSKNISFSYFVTLRKHYFPNVIIPSNSRLGKCDLCITLQQKKMKASTLAEYQSFCSQYSKHNQDQMKERLLYKDRTVLSKLQPENYLSLIIDSMQHKFIPMVSPLPKNYATCEKLKLHITGVINHSNNDRFFYGSLDHWPHGSNFIISVMNIYLSYYNELLQTQQKPWPTTLFLQLDNCWKENKNKYVFSYLSTLIQRHLFDEIYMYCLPTGHTHEDIDQLFSSFTIHYWKHGFRSIPSMDAFLQVAYPSLQSRPKFKMITQVWDLKEYFTPYLVSIQGYSPFRAFSFKRTLNEQVVFHYKTSSLADTWLGFDAQHNGIVILNSKIFGDPKVLATLPLNSSGISQPLQNPVISNFLNSSDKIWFNLTL